MAIKFDELLEALDLDNKEFIPTGLRDSKAKDVLDSVMGQLSDGIWENSPGMNKYWEHADIDFVNDEINIIVDNSWRSGFKGKSPEEIKKWFAKKIKQIIKEEGLDWKRDNEESAAYMHGDIKVRDAYRVYDKLLGRIDRITESLDNMWLIIPTEKRYDALTAQDYFDFARKYGTFNSRQACVDRIIKLAPDRWDAFIPMRLESDSSLNEALNRYTFGEDFEKHIPHNMRYKEYDFVKDNGQDILYWVTQNTFNDSDIEDFQYALSDQTDFDGAFVILRDNSSYSYYKDRNSGKGVFIENTYVDDFEESLNESQDDGKKLFKEFKILVDGRVFEISHTPQRKDEIVKLLSQTYPDSEIEVKPYNHYESGSSRKRLERIIANQLKDYNIGESLKESMTKEDLKSKKFILNYLRHKNCDGMASFLSNFDFNITEDPSIKKGYVDFNKGKVVLNRNLSPDKAVSVLLDIFKEASKAGLENGN